MTGISTLTILSVATVTLISIDLPSANSGSLLCPAGTQLAPDSFSCVQVSSPGRRSSSSNSGSNFGSQVGNALSAASAILSIASILGESLTPTDNVGPIAVDRSGYGARSREENRQGFLQLQKGNFVSAKLSFVMAARNAGFAGNYIEEEKNSLLAELSGFGSLRLGGQVAA